MPFKVRATRRDDGGYDLSYGKGSKKLTSCIMPSVPPQPKGKFQLTVSGQLLCSTFSQCKTWWGEWAEKNYGGEPDDGTPEAGETFPVPLDTPARLEQEAAAAEAEPINKRYTAFITGWKPGPPPQVVERGLAKDKDRVALTFRMSNGASLQVKMSKSAARDLAFSLSEMAAQ